MEPHRPAALVAAIATLALAARIARALAAPLAVVFAMGLLPGTLLRRTQAPTRAPSAAADRSGALEVTVRDGKRGPPLAGAHVRVVAVVDGRAYFAGAADTPAAGVVRIPKVPRGELWVFAEATGRARASSRLVLDSATASVLLEVAPGHAIDVVVHDDRGAALVDAEVDVLSSTDPLPVGARCGPDGVAHVTRLAEGPWKIVARAPGYEDGSARAQLDGEVVPLTLRTLSTAWVRVLTSAGQPAPNARVAIAGASLWPPRVAETDAQGTVRIGGLLAGAYALRATRGDEVSPTELGLALDRGETKSIDLRLGPGRFVAVRAVDGEGDDADPVGGARVSLAEGGLSPFPIEATTAKNGRARLGPIVPGPATLGARAEGFVARGAIAVPDPPPPELRVVLVHAGAIVGRIVDARGDPIDGAILEIAGTDLNGGPVMDDPRRASFQRTHFEAMLGGPQPLLAAGDLGVVPGPVPPIPMGVGGAALAPAPFAGSLGGDDAQPWVTGADGTFRAAPATPGRVRIVARHPQYVEAQSEIVTLPPGGEVTVNLVMHEGGVLVGRVFDARDRPASGARVFVSATRGTMERSTRAASDGTFAFAALPDAVSLGASAADDDASEVRMAVTIPEGGRQEVTVHLPASRDPLPVVVVDARGRPVDAAQISAVSLAADTPLRLTAFSDARGEAQIRGGKGLPLRVEVRAPAHAPRVVTADESTDSLRVELVPGETAAGRVIEDRGGDAIAGAEVTLYTEVGTRRTTTDRDGSFTLAELAPGPARLRVWASGFGPVTRTITVPDSGGRRAYELDDLRMAASGSVEGVVADPQGKPVAGARVANEHAPTWLVVGANPAGVATTDARGRFTLGELPEGTANLEAYAPDLGRGHASVAVVSGRVTDGVQITLEPPDGGESHEVVPAGGVAVTLGETGSPVQVVIVSVADGSEAERAGLTPGDVLATVDGSAVSSIEDARARLGGPLTDDVVVAVRRGDRTMALRVPREVVRR